MTNSVPNGYWYGSTPGIGLSIVDEGAPVVACVEQEDVNQPERRCGYRARDLEAWVVSPRYKWVTDFSDDRAVACVDDGCAIIDSDGSVLVEPMYWAISPFHYGMASFRVGPKSTDFGYMDWNGRTIWEPTD